MGDPRLITAKVFASMGSIWHSAVPSLEQYTRWVNATRRPYATPVRRVSDAARSALIAETAFELIARRSGSAVDPEARARFSLQSLAGAPPGGPLSNDEHREAILLAQNLKKAIQPTIRRGLVYHPVFPGCGLVDRAVGDVLGNGHLFEIKAVERGFRGLDFRQALTYAALAYSSGVSIERISLVNPRRATEFYAATSSLALDLGAASWIDLMQNLVDAMTEVGPSQ